ncbi:MAG: alpha/beta fold hydrolase [Rhodomicrobium sp.]|nr:alpha/beta fold hydrolase [Rhodomicrobium sp.]
MTLELLRVPAHGQAQPVKLLFVHGICTAAWVWEQSFLPYFAGLGYESYALSLRGHGNSDGREKIQRFGLGDFADDVDWALKQTGGPTIVIGHSLGGAVVQNYFKRGGKAAGAVLLCSVPPHGLLRASAAMFAHNPLLAHELRKALMHGLHAANLDIIEKGLFSHPPGPELRRLLFKRMDGIAVEASRQAMGWTPFAPLPWNMPKLLIMGSEKDQFVPAGDVRLAAIYYGTRAVIVHNGAHAIMLDRNWRDAAEPIAGWLARSFS